MTHVYQWFSLPQTITVRCPGCGGAAILRAPEAHQPTPIRGRLTCESCHLVREDFAGSWPEAAFFRCSVKGHELWAWSMEHAIAIRDYVQSEARDPKMHPGFHAALLHLPKHFLTAKNRRATVDALNKLLGETK